MDGWMDERSEMSRREDGWMDERKNEGMDGWMREDGWIDG
jgi:hypothetical protein